MKQRSSFFLIVALLLFGATSVFADYGIYFQYGKITPSEYEFRIENVPTGGHAVLQFFEPLSRSDRSRLESAGIELLGYLPQRAYAVKLTKELSARELTSLGVRAALPFAPEYKLHPRILAGDFGDWSVYGENLRMFNVDIFSDVKLVDAAAALNNAGFEVGDHIDVSHTLVVAIDPAKLMDAALLDPVMFINEMSPPLEHLNATVRTRLHVNEVQAAPYNLSGQGVTLLVYDGGLADGTHPDFAGRFTAMEDGAVADHPTHVAGTAGGSGSASGGTYRGMAPAVTIISGEYDACTPFCFYNSPADVSADYITARTNHGIELTTNSMGANIDPNSYPCSWFGDYELTSRILDGMVKHTVDRPLTMFWAAGNERGGTNCGISSYRCMSIPASAKNIMTIGATTSADVLASFSSFGPTDDGRIKPEVVAMGVNVNSCAPGGGYQVMSGTSMATPASAGVACLVLEQWHLLYPGAPDPLPEAIKALFINSTTDLGSAGPDYQSGFGLINAQKAVDQLRAGGVRQGSLEIDQTLDIEFEVAENTPSIDVSLAWTDVPAVGNVTPTLVNDLNIVLISPANLGYQPWVLNPASPGTAAQPGTDSVNVCEKVRVNNPIPGTWRARVFGTINSGEAQTFALASSVPLVDEWCAISGHIHLVGQPNTHLAGVVEVVGEGIVALTDQDGAYTIYVPRGETYQLRGRSFGHIPVTIDVSANQATISQDFALVNTTSTVTVNGTVETQLGAPVAGAVVTYEFPNATIDDDTADANGNFTVALPISETYVFHAESGGLHATQSVTLPNNGSIDLTLTIEDTQFSPVGPDGGGYYCYESSDTGYAPTFEFTSIAPAAGGPGTLIGPGTGNDWIIQVPLPFNARFYGTIVGGLSVSADGWIGFGAVAGGAQPWTNGFIPSDDLPNNAVYVFWDDLFPYRQDVGGQIASYYDEPNGRFIIEYYQVSQFDPATNLVTAQFVLYTQGARPTTTGDSEFEIHYERFDYDGPDADMDATLGIENSNGSAGLMVYFDGGSDPNQGVITAGTALRYTTGPILGTGTVTGQITAIPATDLSTATLRMGALAFAPESDGSFSVSGVPSGQFRLEFEFAGYENLTSEQFTIPVGGTANVDMNAYRLDAPETLEGDYDTSVNEILLTWNAPTWADGLRDGGDRSLDALSNYTLLIGGRAPITGIADTFFVYSPPSLGVYRFWVAANYDGGVSDSSNLVQFIVTEIVAADDHTALIPDEFYLNQNYPNPFNPTTTIAFGLPVESHVTLDVYDITGRVVARLLNSRVSAGHHQVNFDAARLGSGVYFYRIDTGAEQEIRKMMLLR